MPPSIPPPAPKPAWPPLTAASTQIRAYNPLSGQVETVTVEDQRTGGCAYMPLEGDGLPIVRDARAAASNGMLRPFVMRDASGRVATWTDGTPHVELNDPCSRAAVRVVAGGSTPGEQETCIVAPAVLFRKPLGERQWLMQSWRDNIFVQHQQGLAAPGPSPHRHRQDQVPYALHQGPDGSLCRSWLVNRPPAGAPHEGAIGYQCVEPGRDGGWPVGPVTLSATSAALSPPAGGWRAYSEDARHGMSHLVQRANSAAAGLRWHPDGEATIHQVWLGPKDRGTKPPSVAEGYTGLRPDAAGGWERADMLCLCEPDLGPAALAIRVSSTTKKTDTLWLTKKTKQAKISSEGDDLSMPFVCLVVQQAAAFCRDKVPARAQLAGAKGDVLYWGTLDASGRPHGDGIIRPCDHKHGVRGWEWVGREYHHGHGDTHGLSKLTDGGLFYGRLDADHAPSLRVVKPAEGPFRRISGWLDQGRVEGPALAEFMDGRWMLANFVGGRPRGPALVHEPSPEDGRDLRPPEMATWSDGAPISRTTMGVFAFPDPQRHFTPPLVRADSTELRNIVSAWEAMPSGWPPRIASTFDDQDETLLHRAARRGAPEDILRALIRLGVNVKQASSSQEAPEATALSLLLGDGAKFRGTLNAFARSNSAGKLLDTAYVRPDSLRASARVQVAGPRSPDATAASLVVRARALCQAGASQTLPRGLRVLSACRQTAKTRAISLSVRMLAIWRNDVPLLCELLQALPAVPPVAPTCGHHQSNLLRAQFRLMCEAAYAAHLGHDAAMQVCRAKLVQFHQLLSPGGPS